MNRNSEILKVQSISVSFLLMIGIIANCYSTAKAQLPLSLSDAVQIGLNRNFDVVIVEDQEKIARINNSIGTAGFLPTLSLNALSSNRYTDADNPASFLNNKYRNLSVTPSLQMNWTLFNGFRAHINKSKLELLEEQSAGNVALVMENTIQAIILGYNRVLVEQEKLDVFKQILKLSRERYEYVYEKREIGTGTTFDVLLVKNAYYSDSSEYILQEMNYRNSLRNLNLLLAEEADVQYKLTDDLRETYHPYELEILKEEMFSNNESLKNQYINQALFRREVKLQQSELYPVIGFETGTSYSNTFFKREEAAEIKGNSFDYYFNFSLNFNLFNGGNNIRNIKNAKIQEQISLTTTDQMKLELSVSLSNSLEEYQTQMRLMNLNNTLVKDAKLNLNLAEDKFKSGVITSFEFRDTQNAYISAELTLLQIMSRLHELDTALLRLIGGLIQADQ